jgi:hypothetical protein
MGQRNGDTAPVKGALLHAKIVAGGHDLVLPLLFDRLAKRITIARMDRCAKRLVMSRRNQARPDHDSRNNPCDPSIIRSFFPSVQQVAMQFRGAILIAISCRRK